jgi:hypothetical protein
MVVCARIAKQNYWSQTYRENNVKNLPIDEIIDRIWNDERAGVLDEDTFNDRDPYMAGYWCGNYSLLSPEALDDPGFRDGYSEGDRDRRISLNENVEYLRGNALNAAIAEIARRLANPSGETLEQLTALNIVAHGFTMLDAADLNDYNPIV